MTDPLFTASATTAVAAGIIGLTIVLYKLFKKTCYKYIQLGTWLEMIINIITVGKGERIALWISKKVFNKNKCYCCEIKQWLNRLTIRNYNGHCEEIISW